jgi:hypothetical protein
MKSRPGLIDLIRAMRRIPSALTRGSQARRHRALMKEATRYSIADMPENTFGKLVGRARPSNKRLIEAPLSGRLCVYFEVAIDAISGGAMVRQLAAEQEGIAFILDDDTGRAYIDPATAYMSTAQDKVATSTLALASPRQEALLTRHGLSGRKVPFGTDGLRYREAIIEADERIAVFGGGVREPDPDADPSSYRDGIATRLCLIGTDQFPLFISDDPAAL